MPDFEWRFKEENDPDDLPPAARPGRRRRKWGRFFAITLFIVACIGGVAFVVLAQRANVIIDDRRRDVLASYTLVQRAIAQSDAELFRTLVSEDSADWRSDVQRLFDQKLLPAGDRLGLTPLDGDPQVGVALSRDLKEAEVTTDRTYIAQLGDGVTQTVVLQQIDIYRFDGERWQWAQPGQDFWGMYQVKTGDMLSLDYPARDADIALRLATDLDAVLARFCAQLVDVECPPDLEIQLRLTTDPSQQRRSPLDRAGIRLSSNSRYPIAGLRAGRVDRHPVVRPGRSGL